MDDAELTGSQARTAGSRSLNPETVGSVALSTAHVAQLRLDLVEERRWIKLSGVSRAVILGVEGQQAERFYLEVTEKRPSGDFWLLAGITPLFWAFWWVFRPLGLLPSSLLAAVAAMAIGVAWACLWRPRVYRLAIPLEAWVRPERNVEALTAIFSSSIDLHGGWRETNRLLLKELAASGVATKLRGRSSLAVWLLLRERNRHGA